MKIIVIGTEGAGKTTLLAALTRYLTKNPGLGVSMTPESRFTADYIAKELATLDAGEWPASTTQNNEAHPVRRLKWTLNLMHENASMSLDLIDTAGQDIRTILCGDDENQYSSVHRTIKEDP